MTLQLVLLFFAAIFVKLTDEFSDFPEKEDYSGIVFGIIYGLLLGVVMANNSILATIGFGIILGALITNKFDSIAHLVGVVTIILTLMWFGNFEPVIFITGIFLLAGFADEKVNDFFDSTKKKTNKIIELIGKYRLVTQMVGLIIAVILIEPLYWLGILVFDIGYHSTGKLAKLITH